MRAILTRVFYTDVGAFGRLDEWVTGERPWLNNMPRESCIPGGLYVCEPTIFRPGELDLPTWEVTHVPGRTEIKLHPFNWPIPQSEGCIGFGTKLGELDGRIAILESKKAFGAFMDRYPLSLGAIELEIRDFAPPTQEWE